MALGTYLLKLYLPLIAGVLAGVILGRLTSSKTAFYLGNFLFWIGVPISIVYFLRGANLTALIGLAPLVAWSAIGLGVVLAWFWLRSHPRDWPPATQGSFLLTAMVGNTGYLGYPIVLALVGPQHFVWALFYDILGTLLGSYSLGLGIALHFGGSRFNLGGALQQILQNPPLWSFFLGMNLRQVAFPPLVDQLLRGLAWLMIALSLVLLGMRLGQLSSWGSWRLACLSLGIKMLLVPLAIGIVLSLLGLHGPMRLALVLQMAMPPAFATLVLTEVYNLDRNLTVTALAGGSLALLLTLPLWLWLFAP